MTTIDIIPPVVALIVSIIISITLFFFSDKLLSKIISHVNLRRILLLFIKGPLLVIILGYSILYSSNYIFNQVPSLLPSILHPDVLSVILQLSILVSILRISSSSIESLSSAIDLENNIRQVITYCLYAIGIIIFIYILLSSPLFPSISSTMWSGINFITGLILTYVTVYVLDLFIQRYIQIFVNREPRLRTTYTFLRRVLLAVVGILGVAISTFSSFPSTSGLISSLFVAAGFTSIVIGLAAQSSLSNLVAGMIVAIAQPFKIGEAVVFRNDFCYIEDIKLIHTILRTWDNRRLMVPNALFQSEVVINYSAEDPTMLVPILFQISYESDVDKAMEIMKNSALNHPDCLPTETIPNVVIMGYADSGVDLRVLSRAKDQPTAIKMTRELFYIIKKEFDNNSIDIPYPHRHIVLDDSAEQVIKRVIDNNEKD